MRQGHTDLYDPLPWCQWRQSPARTYDESNKQLIEKWKRYFISILN